MEVATREAFDIDYMRTSCGVHTSYGHNKLDLAPTLYEKVQEIVGGTLPLEVRDEDYVDRPAKATVLARETAAELIEALAVAYSGADYRCQVEAAIRRPAFGYDYFEDIRTLASVRLSFESPALERFGFTPTTLGQIRAQAAVHEAVFSFPDLEEAKARMESLAFPQDVAKGSEELEGEGEAGEAGGEAAGAPAEWPQFIELSMMREPSVIPCSVRYDELSGRRWLCVGGDSSRGLEVSVGGEDPTVNRGDAEVREILYLQPGSVVEELTLMPSLCRVRDPRLQYKLINGEGPPKGWVFLQDGLGAGHDLMLPLEGPLPMPADFVDDMALELQQLEASTQVALLAEDAPDPAEAWRQRMLEAAAEVEPFKERAQEAVASMVRLQNKDGIERALAQGMAAGVDFQEILEAFETLKRLQEAVTPEHVRAATRTEEESEQSRDDTPLKFELALQRYRFEDKDAKRPLPPKGDNRAIYDDEQRIKEAQTECSVCYELIFAREEYIFRGQFMCGSCVMASLEAGKEERRRALALDDLTAPIEGMLPPDPYEEASQHLALEAGELAPEGFQHLAPESGQLAPEADSAKALRLMDAFELQCQSPEFLADVSTLGSVGGPTFRVGLGLLLTKHCVVAASAQGIGDDWTFEQTKSFLLEHAHSAGIMERLAEFDRLGAHGTGMLFGALGQIAGEGAGAAAGPASSSPEGPGAEEAEGEVH